MHDVYMDYNATAPVRDEALRAWENAVRNGSGNPSSSHFAGRGAKDILDDSRERMASVIGARPRELYFTGGGTESNNIAILGLARAARRGHVIVSPVEHPAVLETCRALESEGFGVTVLPVDSDGVVDPETVRDAIRPDTFLVSVMWVNNETGVIQPVGEVGRIARERGVLFHTDAVQALGRVAVDVSGMPVDLLTISGHKFYAPRGVGALYCRRGVKLAKTVHGGGQERGLRSGTENLPGIAAMAEAAVLATEEAAELSARLAALRDSLEAGILSTIDRTKVNGAGADRVANTSNICFPGTDGEAVQIALDQHKIAVSSASACAATHSGPSHVLLAMGMTREEAGQSIRFSLGRYSSSKDVDRCLEVLPDIVTRLRAVGNH